MSKMKSYFEIQKSALRLCGISLREHETTIFKILTKILLLLACLYTFLAVGDLFNHDYETVVDSLTYVVPLTVGVIKAVAVSLNRKKIAKVLNHLDGDLNFRNFVNGQKENEGLMATCIFITTAQTAVYWIMVIVCASLTMGATLIIRIRSSDYHDWIFPYGKFTILNVTYSPNYEISWAYQCFSIAYLAIVFTTIDLLTAATLCHVCFHLRILQNNLRRIVEDTYRKMQIFSNTSTTMETVKYSDEENANLDWNHLRLSLKEHVEHHLGIVNTAKEIDDSFSVLLLLVFLGTLGMLAFLAYNASLVPLNDVRFLRHLVELCCITLQVLMVCYWGEEMEFEAKQVGYAVYEANFIGTDLRFQKSLSLIIRRSQYPIKLTAGYVDVSLAAFTWILRSTYSYYMILRYYNVEKH